MPHLRGRNSWSLALVLLTLLAAACSVEPPQPTSPAAPPSESADGLSTPPVTRDITEVTMEIVLADTRVSDFLEANPYVVEGVTPLAGNEVVVSIQFEDPTQTEGWPPMSACEVGGAEGPATGVDFQVDIAAGTVVAMSPRWGSVSCLDY